MNVIFCYTLQLLLVFIFAMWGCAGHLKSEKAHTSSTLESDVSSPTSFSLDMKESVLATQPNEKSVSDEDEWSRWGDAKDSEARSAGYTRGLGEDRSEKNEDIQRSIAPESKTSSSLLESQHFRNTEPSSWAKEQKSSGRKKTSQSIVVTEESPDGCAQGRAQLARHQYQGALIAFSESIQIYLTKRLHADEFLELQDCYRQRAYTYLQLNQPTHALADIDRVLEGFQPGEINRSRDFFFRGRVYAIMNVSQHAINDLSEALELGLGIQDQAYAYYLRGLSFLRLTRLKPGLKDLSQGCQADFSEACELLDQIL